ncbi:uncharacterized protein LOC119835837 [Zerene cesonia]|uniref:uncharacterized protein LOC119835837 n=1 Tax=Zerene cesonia TaxID=33412 RepID=UPI0018E5A7B4|nr:uncharacterized protein LOC119835837 [Zerene cesonia]
MNKTVVYAALITLIQASVQIVMVSLAIAQYFCLIDFLRELPILLFIKILYFHNPNSCGTLVNIGQALDEVSDQAVVLITQESLTVTRTLYVNACSLGLAIIWCLGSGIMMRSGRINDRVTVWPWVMTTVAMCTLDLIATVIFINDTFYTRTLSDMMNYIGATASGVRNVVIDTRIASWSMVLLYSRFILIFLMNVVLVIIVVLNRIAKPVKGLEPEAGIVPSSPTPRSGSTEWFDIDLNPTPTLPNNQKIPRAWYNRKRFMDFQSRLFMESEPKKNAYYTNGVYTMPSDVRVEQQMPDERNVTRNNDQSQVSKNTDQADAEPQQSTSRQVANVELPAQLPWTYIPVTVQSSQSDADEVPPLPLKENSLIKKRKAAILSSLSSLTSLTQKKNPKDPEPTPSFKR